MTWGCLWSDIHRIAWSFRRLGLSHGDRLAILLPSCVQWELAHQAALLLGTTIIGVDCSAPQEQLEFVLTDCDATAILLDNQATWDRIPPRVKRQIKFAVGIDKLSKHEGSDSIARWSDLLRSDESGEQLNSGLTADHPATLIYTSGTTGPPKAIQFTHHQLVVACISILEAFPELQERDSTLCWLPMSNLFQRMVNMMAIARGMAIYFIEDPQNVLLQLEKIKPSFFAAVPRFSRSWLSRCERTLRYGTAD